MIIHIIPEGFLEEQVGRRLLAHCGHELGTVYNSRTGCDYIRERAILFRPQATAQSGVLVLTDFRDSRAGCVPQALNEYALGRVPELPRTFLFRFAVAELESWFLADREGLSGFLGIPARNMPKEADTELLPKQTLVNLARRSRRTRIRTGIVPEQGHQGSAAPLYTATMSDFIMNHWNIDAAALSSPSLARCVRRLRELV